MKILVVDDALFPRLHLQEMLKDYGTVHLASNGREAVDFACLAMDNGEPYELICLDVMMPEMNGQQALKEIREQERQRKIESSNRTKIIMITALGDAEQITEAYTNQCNAFARKPLDKKWLLKILHDLELIT